MNPNARNFVGCMPASRAVTESETSSLFIGAGMHDITGPAAEAGMFGYAKPSQSSSGIHIRLRSRAFCFHHVVHDTYFVFVSVDLGQITELVTRQVMERLNDPSSSVIPLNTFSANNVMISAVHTHCAPGGFSEYPLYNYHPPIRGFDKQNFECIVDGIVQSITRSYQNLQMGHIRVSKGLCLGASVNRSREAYEANSEEERSKYEYDTDNEMTLWRMDGVDGFPIGMINWFAVHPTSMGSWFTLITGDNKGYASQVFEKEQGVYHLMDKPRAFVAAFAQGNEGDVSPNIFGPRESLDESKDVERMIMVGNAQLDAARRLYKEALKAPKLEGPIRVQHEYVDYSDIELEAKWHMYRDCPRRTSSGCLGISMLSGATFDGPGLPIPEGVKFGDYSNISLVPGLQRQQKEKLIACPTGHFGLTPSILPLQLVTIGDQALIAVPFEVTTMAGRRLRNSVQNKLKQLGINHSVIAGLSNSYSGYMVTREEYSVQRYEGASTHFGPNQLDATMQEFDSLCQAMVEGTNVKGKTAPPPLEFDSSQDVAIIEPEKQQDAGNMLTKLKVSWNLPVVFDGVLLLSKFGDVVRGEDVFKSYVQGKTAKVTFHGGHPKNDLRTQDTFLEIQRKREACIGERKEVFWVIHADDSDESTYYHWNRWGMDASRVVIEWRIPATTPPGRYRIKHTGNYKFGWSQRVHEYTGFSSEFEVMKSNEDFETETEVSIAADSDVGFFTDSEGEDVGDL